LRLSLLVPVTADMETQVSEVLQIAERAGWTTELVRAAFEAKPSDPGIVKVFQDLGLGTPVLVQPSGASDNTLTLTTASDFDPATTGVSQRFHDPAVFRQQLARIERQVCRIEVGGVSSTSGTGFLVSPNWVLTSRHVVRDVIEGRRPPSAVRCRFDYSLLPNGSTSEGKIVGLFENRWLVDSSPLPPTEDTAASRHSSGDDLEYAMLRLQHSIGQEPADGATTSGPLRGWIPVPEVTPPLLPGQPLYLAYYAQGGLLTFKLHAQSIIGLARDNTRLHYRTATELGAAGAPCFNSDWQLVALHQSRVMNPEGGQSDVREGVLISAIRDQLWQRGHRDALAGPIPDIEVRSASTDESASRPAPGPILDPEDPQKGRWGGASEQRGRRLSAQLTDASRRLFSVDLTVSSTDGSILEGPVVFHLHDSFPKWIIHINKIRDGVRAVLEEVVAYGVFTVGAQVKDASGQWLGLELDLCDLAGLPDHFRSL
jgi:hypothetical protein